MNLFHCLTYYRKLCAIFLTFSNTFTCLNLQKCENTFIASEHQLRRQSVIAQNSFERYNDLISTAYFIFIYSSLRQSTYYMLILWITGELPWSLHTCLNNNNTHFVISQWCMSVCDLDNSAKHFHQFHHFILSFTIVTNLHNTPSSYYWVFH